jgi:hypothetical protein
VSTPDVVLNKGGDPLASSSFRRNPARASDRLFGN